MSGENKKRNRQMVAPSVRKKNLRAVLVGRVGEGLHVRGLLDPPCLFGYEQFKYFSGKVLLSLPFDGMKGTIHLSNRP